jgi:hypothetical protein
VSVADLALVPGDAANPFYVKATLRREGNRSVYGNFRVSVARGGRDTQVGATDGVAIYDGVDSRTVMIPVKLDDGVTLNGNRLRVSMVDAEQSDAGDDLLAEAFLDVP